MACLCLSGLQAQEEITWVEHEFPKFGLRLSIPDDATMETEKFAGLPRWGGAHVIGAHRNVEIWGLARKNSDPDKASLRTLCVALTEIPPAQWEKLPEYSNEEGHKGMTYHQTYRHIDGRYAHYIVAGKTQKEPGSAVMLYIRGPVGSFGENHADWDTFYEGLSFFTPVAED